MIKNNKLKFNYKNICMVKKINNSTIPFSNLDKNTMKILENLYYGIFSKENQQCKSMVFAGIDEQRISSSVEKVVSLTNGLGYSYCSLDMNCVNERHEFFTVLGITEEFSNNQKLTNSKFRMIIHLQKIEKASGEIINIILRLLDKGELVINDKIIDMSDCILIFTSSSTDNIFMPILSRTVLYNFN